MSEILTEDGSAYVNSITVPTDGDARNAGSVRVSFQALANRTAHFWSKLVNAVLNGGTFTSAGDVTWTMAPNKTLKVTAQPGYDAGLDLTGLVSVSANQNVRGPLFEAGFSGRANRRPLVISSGSGTIDVDTSLYDTVIVTSGITGVVNLRIVPTSPVTGDWLHVVNYHTTNAVNVSAGGATPQGDSGVGIQTATAHPRSATYVLNGSWYQVASSAYV